jgi:hypothetical protein
MCGSAGILEKEDMASDNPIPATAKIIREIEIKE